jgi:hypothetical protein
MGLKNVLAKWPACHDRLRAKVLQWPETSLAHGADEHLLIQRYVLWIAGPFLTHPQSGTLLVRLDSESPLWITRMIPTFAPRLTHHAGFGSPIMPSVHSSSSLGVARGVSPGTASPDAREAS